MPVRVAPLGVVPEVNPGDEAPRVSEPEAVTMIELGRPRSHMESRRAGDAALIGRRAHGDWICGADDGGVERMSPMALSGDRPSEGRWLRRDRRTIR
ncbi:MAG: hypothetical protein ACRDV6_05690 [Acidimicrobiales bacterium]